LTGFKLWLDELSIGYSIGLFYQYQATLSFYLLTTALSAVLPLA
jgi:hypothetical protein